MSAPNPRASPVSPLRWRAALWLAFLGPFFFLSYGFANNWAASQAEVGSVVFDWEREYIPFVPALMLPYMSIDLFYAASLFVAKSRRELDRHAQRLLLATVVSVACFLAFPLRVTFEKPEVAGFNGFLLEMLHGFDKPFNAAPSLHISLLIILWAHYARHLNGLARFALHVWFGLIGVSVLLTWQHHFFDVPTGALVGFGVLHLLPQERNAWQWRGSSPRGRRIAAAYAFLAGLCGWGGAAGGAALWLYWPAVSFALMALAYAGAGPAILGKRPEGGRSIAAAVLLWPYLLLADLNRTVWARYCPGIGEATSFESVVLRSHPGWHGTYAPLVDLCPELGTYPARRRMYRSVPLLDLVAPRPRELDRAVVAIAVLQRSRIPVHVCCALGLGRSAAVVAAWLLYSGQCGTVEEAIALVSARRTDVVFPAEVVQTLRVWWSLRVASA